MKRRAAVALAALLVTMSACADDAATPRAAASPTESSESPTASSAIAITPSPGETSTSAEASPLPETSPSPVPEPLGPSRARLTVTGDIRAKLNLPLAALDSFSATWCDARDCANAANGLQLMGERFGMLGTHETPRGLFVTVEVQDRFIYVSGDQYTQGDCTVTLTVADDRGYAGKIVCPSITNGTGVGILTLSVRGDFVAAY